MESRAGDKVEKRQRELRWSSGRSQGQADRRVPPFMELPCCVAQKEKASVTGVNYSDDS